jgi:hypothetical protein
MFDPETGGERIHTRDCLIGGGRVDRYADVTVWGLK